MPMLCRFDPVQGGTSIEPKQSGYPFVRSLALVAWARGWSGLWWAAQGGSPVSTGRHTGRITDRRLREKREAQQLGNRTPVTPTSMNQVQTNRMNTIA